MFIVILYYENMKIIKIQFNGINESKEMTQREAVIQTSERLGEIANSGILI